MDKQPPNLWTKNNNRPTDKLQAIPKQIEDERRQQKMCVKMEQSATWRHSLQSILAICAANPLLILIGRCQRNENQKRTATEKNKYKYNIEPYTNGDFVFRLQHSACFWYSRSSDSYCFCCCCWSTQFIFSNWM